MTQNQRLTLSQIRKTSPYKVKDVADHMGVSTRTIHLWEKGEREMAVKDLRKLLGFYGVDMPVSETDALFASKDGP